MQTITYYSYKGGVGRSLALANNAYYLSKFGYKVCIIDFDLEAPGLNYKFNVKDADIDLGIIDYIFKYWNNNIIPGNINDYTVQLNKNEGEGDIILIPAGQVNSNSYWQKLSSIDWHNLLFSNEKQGLLFFLELKERIKREINPDFLLVDSRTGVTEIGGICTTVLPETVIFLMTNNNENIDGTARILSGIENAPRINNKEIETHFVLTRVPHSNEIKTDTIEENTINKIRERIRSVSKIEVNNIFVIHSNRNIELEESLILESLGNSNDKGLNRLMDDYISLFSNILNRSAVEPRLKIFVDNILINTFDYPDDTQRKLEEISNAFPHPLTLSSLLKLYKLRNLYEKYLLTYPVYHQLSDGKRDLKLFEEYVSLFKRNDLPYSRYSKFRLDIIAEYLTYVRYMDIQLGIKLSSVYDSIDRKKSLEINLEMLKIVEDENLKVDVLLPILSFYYDEKQFDVGYDLMAQYTDLFSRSDKYKIMYIRYLSAMNNSVLLHNLLIDNKLINEQLILKNIRVFHEAYGKIKGLDYFWNNVNSSLIRSIKKLDYDNMKYLYNQYEAVDSIDIFERIVNESNIDLKSLVDRGVIRRNQQ